jgi:hypothetical protein
MRLDNEHFTEVEILSFNSRCKMDDMSYEQTVNVRTKDGELIRLFDFMGFAVNESRLGPGKKLVLCVRHINGEIALLQSGKPHIVSNDFAWESETASRLTIVGEVVEANTEDHDLLVDVGFGEIYVLPDDEISRFTAGDTIMFKAERLDLLEILEETD